MRVRVIIEGRYAWRDEGPGNGAAGASGYHGSIVQGEPGAVQRGRTQTNARRRSAHMLATRVRAPEGRDPKMWWRSAAPCGVLMPRVNLACARRAGHADCHRSPVAVLAERARRAAA